MNIGEGLKKLREHKNFSQLSLAKASGVSQSVISDIEAEKTTSPRVDTLACLAEALGCTVDDLLKDTESEL